MYIAYLRKPEVYIVSVNTMCKTAYLRQQEASTAYLRYQVLYIAYLISHIMHIAYLKGWNFSDTED